MKNTLILHGTDGNSTLNWFPWLKKELQEHNYLVWCPDLPKAEKPNIQRYNQFLFENKDFEYNSETILVGHSSGAVTILGLLQALPDNITVDTCYFVGSFKDDLGWDSLKELFIEPFDFEKMKTKAKRFVFLHSDNDPYCPLEHARYLQSKVGGELIVQPNQKHFSIGTAGEKYTEFPFLLELIVNGGYKNMVIDFLRQYQLMALATYGEHPWIANVYYAVDDDLSIYFLSDPQTQHCKDIESNSKVAVSVLDSTQTPIKTKGFTKVGVQMCGEALQLSKVDEIRAALEKWKRSLNILSDGHFNVERMMKDEIKGRMFKVLPKKIKMFDEKLFKENEVPVLEI